MQTLRAYYRIRNEVEQQHRSTQVARTSQSSTTLIGDLNTSLNASTSPLTSVPTPTRSNTLIPQVERSVSGLSGIIRRSRLPPPDRKKSQDEKDSQEDLKTRVESDDEHGDQANPQNWSHRKRLGATTILFVLVFSQGWVSTCDTNVTKPAAAEFHVSQTSETLATALFLVGIASGSLIAGPLSEELGRNPVYLISTAIYLCFTLGAALSPNFGSQITFRFLSGLFSSPALSIYGGSLADLYPIDERKNIWSIFALSPLLSPILSSVAGGWINGIIYWRWVYWIGLIFSFAAFMLALLFLPETFSPMILLWRAHHLRQVTDNQNYMCALEEQDSLLKRLASNLIRPAQFFTTEPIIIALGAYLIVVYVVIFTFLNGMEFIFTDTYGLSSGITSLAFVGITIGALFFACSTPIFNRAHRSQLRKQKLNGSTGPPELLLYPAMWAAPFFSISLFWLGWTNYPSISYWSGYAAIVVFGFSMTAIFVSSYIYIINSYGTWSSSALGSITLARYFVSSGMVVASRPMYEGIGVHWTLTLLGALGAILVPTPYLIYRYGEVIRRKSKFAVGGTEDAS